MVVHVKYASGAYEWYTPRWLVEAARDVLGEIELDPASSLMANQIVRAKKFYTLSNSGLPVRWRGRFFLNPPYCYPEIVQFTEKVVASVEAGDVYTGIVLTNNATETRWFQHLSTVVSAVSFPASRVKFWRPNGGTKTPLQGQAISYIGAEPDKFIARFEQYGIIARIQN